VPRPLNAFAENTARALRALASLARVPVGEQELRDTFARWATGVTIVTSRAGERVHGMTVSAFTEVSLAPPLVLVCADQSSHTHALIAETGLFAVNVLGRGQEALSDRFASKKDEDRRFEGLAYQTGRTGAPLLPDCIAHLDCRVVATHEAGDHVLYVGRVVEVRRGDGEPLLHYNRSYGGFAVGRSG
jgi:flavin reductase (DIM6/NTAB) family NADH-FMN oxidoreductase RutF